jgi:ABC-type Fe3+-siderophore transport system permease subunit
MAMSSAASDPLYYDVSPEYERYTKFFLMVSALVCLISVICAIVKAQEEKKFYIIIISLAISLIFVICIYMFFKRRILLAEKLWFVNLTIFIFFLQALIYLIFVFIKPYPIPITTTSTIRPTTHSTRPHNSTNSTNVTTTTTTRSTSTTRRFDWDKKVILTKLYELDGI